MDYAAVVTGLVRGDSSFFFQDEQPAIRVSLEQLKSHGEADDTGADDRYVKLFFQDAFLPTAVRSGRSDY
jgi:hypothetical protein